jgi:hypothetical protein
MIKNKLLILIATSLISFSTTAKSLFFSEFVPFQESNDSTQIITKLLEERASLIKDKKSTRPVDKELASLGHLPKAVVNKKTTKDSFLLTFEIYHEIEPDKKDRIIDRLKRSFQEIKTIDINTDQYSVKVEFFNTVSEEKVNEFLIILGYSGYVK